MLALSRSRLIGTSAVAGALLALSAFVPAYADGAASASSAAAPAAAPAPAADPVVAVVNGSQIHRSELDEVKQELASINPQFGQATVEQAFSYLVDRAITEHVLTAAALKDNLQDDPKVKASVEVARSQILQSAYINKAVTAGMTDAVLQARYQQFLKDNPPVEQVHVRHILLADEKTAIAEIKKLKAGAKFEDLAKKDSKDTGSAANGGDLPFFKQQGEMVQEFADAAFALKVGEITDKPVKTQFGYHIIKLLERRPAPQPTFDEAKDQIRQLVGQDIVRQTVESLRKTASVQQFDINGNPLPPPAAAPAPGAAPAAAPAASGSSAAQ